MESETSLAGQSGHVLPDPGGWNYIVGHSDALDDVAIHGGGAMGALKDLIEDGIAEAARLTGRSQVELATEYNRLLQDPKTAISIGEYVARLAKK